MNLSSNTELSEEGAKPLVFLTLPMCLLVLLNLRGLLVMAMPGTGVSAVPLTIVPPSSFDQIKWMEAGTKNV